MPSLSRRTGRIITLAVAFVAVLAFLYYVIFPSWIKNQIHGLKSDSNTPFNISVEKIHATAWPIGLLLKNVSIQQLSSERTVTDSLLVKNITIQHFNPISYLFQNKYNVGHITLDQLDGQWALLADDSLKVEIAIPFPFSCKTLTLKNIALVLKQEGTSQETNLNGGNFILKNVLLEKDSLLKTITYEVSEINLTSMYHVSSDSFYTFRAHQMLYSDKDSTLLVDSFFSIPNLEKYAFARQYPYQTDRVHAAFKNITFKQFDLNAWIFAGDLRTSSIHTDSFLLDIFRDRRRPFLHKKRPLYQDLLYAFPGVLSVDSIVVDNGKIIFTEHDINASEPGVIWFSNVRARLQHLYNDTTIAKSQDSFIVAAHALAMGKGKIQFESKGNLRDPQNTFVFNGSMENISVAAFNPILVPNTALEALDGYVNGIYFNFIADNSRTHGDLIFRYQDLRLLKVSKKTGIVGGLKNRLLTRVLNRKMIDDNPLPNDTLRKGTIHFERDPEKMFFWYMLKSIFSGIKETVMK